MVEEWCPVCCCRHRNKKDCPGELLATGPERQGWRVNVQTPTGIEGCGVLIAPSGDSWRARILTYPNILWTVPDGKGTLKFVGQSPREAERQAIEFVRRHIHDRGYTMRDEIALAEPGDVEAEAAPEGLNRPSSPPALRRVRFLPVRFGVAQITEIAGTGNLSETGLFIITGSPEKDGTWLNMLLELDDDPIGLRGLVRWKNRQHRVGRSPGMGVQLEEPPPSYLSYVRGLS
jgi:hypothetical protein